MNYVAKPRSKKRPHLQQGSADEGQPSDTKRASTGTGAVGAKKLAVGKDKKAASEKPSKPKSARRKSADSDSKKRAADQLNFPERLMQLINDNVAPDHVSWIDNEEAISFKTDGFQEQVLDKFFQGLKYDSFVRKLNRWYVASFYGTDSVWPFDGTIVLF